MQSEMAFRIAFTMVAIGNSLTGSLWVFVVKLKSRDAPYYLCFCRAIGKREPSSGCPTHLRECIGNHRIHHMIVDNGQNLIHIGDNGGFQLEPVRYYSWYPTSRTKVPILLWSTIGHHVIGKLR